MPRPRAEGAARRRGAEAGYALLLALFVLFLLSIALALVGLSLSIRLRLVKAESESVMRGALADAALDEALANLAQTAAYSGSRWHPLGDGEIQSRVLGVGGVDQFQITAAGLYAGRVRRIEVVARRTGPGRVTVESWRLDPVGDRMRSSRGP